ncbi:hypothetical protein G3A43_38285 [Paraburkholderia aspalathi]|uniref:fatty acid desaturase n=1 Tax=Paraburkholderia nemoris TaxID=2793076 RepID=UPI0019096743|nr:MULTISPECIES: fatty acid desaturase [Paraburkholderia]MBK3786072.1 hypothetical protein [Paraburkholderia aspalathi]
MMPIIDEVIGPEQGASSQNGKQTGATRVTIPHWFLIGWLGAILMALGVARHASVVELIGLAFGCGILSAMAMAHIHEIMHRGSFVSRTLSEFAFVIVGYPHYRLAHRLHHANVGNPRFGSTAAIGQSVWHHVPRSFMASLKATVEHDAAWTRVLRGYFAVSMLLAIAFRFGSWRSLLFCLGYGLISVFLVEAVGYLQHYGLDGGVAIDSGHAAWDVHFWLSNRLLSNNGLHAHHHHEQTQTYERLSAMGQALPGGYLHMLWFALVPRLWFSTMDRRVRMRLESVDK